MPEARATVFDALVAPADLESRRQPATSDAPNHATTTSKYAAAEWTIRRTRTRREKIGVNMNVLTEACTTLERESRIASTSAVRANHFIAAHDFSTTGLMIAVNPS